MPGVDILAGAKKQRPHHNEALELVSADMKTCPSVKVTNNALLLLSKASSIVTESRGVNKDKKSDKQKGWAFLRGQTPTHTSCLLDQLTF